MNTMKHVAEVIKELERTLSQISEEEAEQLSALIRQSKTILVAGAGRSGLAVKAFAMRLMHLGFNAHVVGETVTPGLEAGDLLLIASGSGETASLVSMAEKAGKIGARLALVSIFPQSSIGRLADVSVRIPAPTPKISSAQWTSIQPMGSLFEQSLFLFFDLLTLQLMAQTAQDSSAMFARHATIE